MDLATKTITFGTIEKNGVRYTKDGYFCTIRTEGRYGYTEREYCIHPDGTCLFRFEDNSTVDLLDGTFEASRYESFVSMMRDFRTDWISELSFEEDTDETI